MFLVHNNSKKIRRKTLDIKKSWNIFHQSISPLFLSPSLIHHLCIMTKNMLYQMLTFGLILYLHYLFNGFHIVYFFLFSDVMA